MSKRNSPALANVKRRDPPWLPSEFLKADVYAIKALAAGTASDLQQKRALNWIIRMTDYYGMSYSPDNSNDTDFAEGKRFAGAQIVKLINLPSETLGRMKDVNINSDSSGNE